MKRFIIVVLVVLLVLGLLACAAPSAEQAAEKIIEDLTGSEVDIDKAGDAISIKNEEGEIQGSQSGIPWPGDKLPASIPEFKDITVISVVDVKIGILITYEDCSENEINAYVDQLSGTGWTSDQEFKTEDVSQYIFKDNQGNMFNIGWTKEEGSGTITYSKVES